MKLNILAIALLIGATMHVQGEDNAELPNVLIIGDSISIGYTKPLKAMLGGKAVVSHNAGNAAHSEHGLAKLESWLGKITWDVIHFNHGLHDLKYVDKNRKNSKTKDNAHIQVPLDKYAENMEAIVIRLKKTGAKLIFATTTPYPEGVSPLCVPEDAAKYNAVALEIIKEHGVIVNDLYAFVLPQLKTLQRPMNVHFTPEGSTALAKEVEKHVLKALGQQSPAGDSLKAAPEE